MTGPSATKDRAVRTQGQKSQREKSAQTSCLWRRSFVLNSIPSCHSCLDRARHLELPGQAGVSKQTSHLVFLGNRGVSLCAGRRMGPEKRMDKPGSQVSPVPAGDR